MNKFQYAGLLLAVLFGGRIADLLHPQPFAAQEAAGTVEAEEFVLKGKDGKVRARLAVDEHETGSIAFYDGTGKLRGKICSDINQDFGLHLEAAREDYGRAQFTVDKIGGAEIRFTNDDSHDRLRVYSGDKNCAGLEISRHDGRASLQMEASESLFSMSAFGNDYTRFFDFQIEDDEGATMKLLKTGGEAVWSKSAK